MPNDGSGTGWNESLPADSDDWNKGAQEIRDVRKGLRIRLEKEHEDMAASSAGGEHLAGSAKAYHQSAEPTQRPDAATSLDSNDAGRLFIDSDDGRIYYYNGSAWTEAAAAAVFDGTIVDADINASADIDGSKFLDDSITAAKLEDTDVIDLGAKVAAGIIGGTAGTKAHIEAKSINDSDIEDGSLTMALLATAVTDLINGASQVEVSSAISGSDSASIDHTFSFTPTVVISFADNGTSPYMGFTIMFFPSNTTSHIYQSWSSSALGTANKQNSGYSSGDQSGGAIRADGQVTVRPWSFARINKLGETYRWVAIG